MLYIMKSRMLPPRTAIMEKTGIVVFNADEGATTRLESRSYKKSESATAGPCNAGAVTQAPRFIAFPRTVFARAST